METGGEIGGMAAKVMSIEELHQKIGPISGGHETLGI